MNSRYIAVVLGCVLSSCMCGTPKTEPPGPAVSDAGEPLGAPWGLGIARGHTDIVDVPPTIQHVLYPPDAWNSPRDERGGAEVVAADFFASQHFIDIDSPPNIAAASLGDPR